MTIVVNPSPDDGQVSSQRLGLEALSGKLDLVVMALADQPLINTQDVVDLIGAWKKRPDGTEVLYPQVNGQPGNPVLLSTHVKEQILTNGGNAGCRQWQEKHPELTFALATENRRYRIDIDTEQDLSRFEQDTGHKLLWPKTVTDAAC